MDAFPVPSYPGVHRKRLMAPLSWFGGKGKMLAKLLPLIPYGRLYCEPFGGAGSILLNREPSPVELLNDLHGNLINLYRHIQDKDQDLIYRLKWTLYSRDEFRKAIGILQDPEALPLDRAWAMFVATNQGFSGTFKSEGNWGRSVTASNRGMAQTVAKWQSRLALFEQWHQRLARVQLENRDGLAVIDWANIEDAVIYVDPPYPLATRKSGGYLHECTDEWHRSLVAKLKTFAGSVVASSYDNPIYAELETVGYERLEFQTVCHAAGKTRKSGLQGEGAALKKVPRTEVIWRRIRPLHEQGVMA